jgi:hypothetical protein
MTTIAERRLVNPGLTVRVRVGETWTDLADDQQIIGCFF